MNKKYVKYSVLAMLLMVCKPSFAMYGNFFKLARLAGVAALPAYGLYKANKLEKKVQKPLGGTLISEYLSPEELGVAVDQWFTEKKRQLNVPNAEKISLIVGPQWASFGGKVDKVIMISPDDILDLSAALYNKSIYEKNRYNSIQKLEKSKNEKSRDRLYYEASIKICDEAISICDKIIVAASIIASHELGHIVHKDSESTSIAVASIPVGVETVFGASTWCFNKSFNRKLPKTLMSTFLRSTASIGSIIPKVLCGSVLFTLLVRNQEVQADKYAYSHCTSCLEFEEDENKYRNYYDLWKLALKEKPESLIPHGLSNVPSIVQEGYRVCARKGLDTMSQRMNDPQTSEKDKENMVKIAYELCGPTHPDFKQRLGMAKHYHDKLHVDRGDQCSIKAIERQ